MKYTPLIALCLGFFMVIIDVTIVNVALPSIAIGLHTNLSWLEWIMDGYTLTFACLLLTAGHMGDQFGAKKLFQYGVSFFVITSFCCGISTSAWMLTLFRLLQGASAAFIVPTSLALINELFLDNKTRSKAIGIWGGIGGIAAATGPILGAVLTSLFSWRAVFFVNILFGLACFLLTSKYIANSAVSHQKIKLDWVGQTLGIICVAALAASLIEVGRLGWSSTIIITGFCLFIVTLIAFVVTESRVKTPMFPLIFFKSKSFSIAILIGVILNTGFYGELFILPLYFQHVRGYTVMMTGFALLPLVISMGLSSYLSGKLVSIIGPKWPMVAGLCIAVIGFVSTSIIGEYSSPYWEFLLPFTLIGFGCAFTMPAATIAIIRSVTDSRAGIASGAFNTSRQVGSLMGVAIFGTIITTSSQFISGIETTLIIAASIFLFGCLMTILIFRENA